MKKIAYILAVYLLILSLIPCGDGGGGIVEIVNHLFGFEHQAHSGHDQHSGSCSDDFCSPFCVCSCCSITVDFPTSADLNFKDYTPIPARKPTFISTETQIIYPSCIWQPPRFS